jgi:O-antigen/teichoic acid export membrane protein
MHMTGRQNAFQRILLAATIINLVLNFTLVPQWGIEGAAVATATSLVVWNVATAVSIRRQFGFFPFYFPGSEIIFRSKRTSAP